MPTRLLRKVAFAPLWLAACFGQYEPVSDQASGSTGTGPGVTSTGLDPTSGTTDAGDTTQAGTTTGDASGGSGSDTTAEPLECDHVDILFVVDFSVSMAVFSDTFGALLPAADELIDGLERVDSYHIGITTNSGVPQNAAAYVPPEGTTGGSMTGGSTTGSTTTTGDSTTGSSGPEPPSCEEIGSLFRPVEQECYEMLEGRPYVTKGDAVAAGLLCLIGEPLLLDLELETPRTVEAIIAALGDANEPGGCNEGFHQAGDPLVIIVVTDADDVGGPFPPIAAATIIANEGTADTLAFTLLSEPTCSCPGAPEPCRGDVGCPAQPPCKLVSVAEDLFGTDQPGRVRETDLCNALRGNDRPFQEALLTAIEEQLPLVCATRR